jgi:hypothetical protein
VVEENGEERWFVSNISEAAGVEEVKALDEFVFSTQERNQGCDVLGDKAICS